jgi:hypothetical protein
MTFFFGMVFPFRLGITAKREDLNERPLMPQRIGCQRSGGLLERVLVRFHSYNVAFLIAVQGVFPAGFEPAISWMKARCPGPLDEGNKARAEDQIRPDCSREFRWESNPLTRVLHGCLTTSETYSYRASISGSAHFLIF